MAGRIRIAPVLAVAAGLGLAVAAASSAAHSTRRPELADDYGFAYTPPEPGSYVLHRIKRAPDGELLDTQGRRRRLSELLAGHIGLVAFVYTRCSDPKGCPLLLDRLFAVHEISRIDPEIGDHLVMLSISLDPDYDRPELLASFEQSVEPGGAPWYWLTADDRETLRPLLRGFGQPMANVGGDQLYHLLRLFLVDPEGWIREIYGLGFLDPRAILGDVRTLLLKEEAPVRSPCDAAPVR